MSVTYEAAGRVAVITLNRPEARNAVNGDVATGMEAAIDRSRTTTTSGSASSAPTPRVRSDRCSPPAPT